MEYITTRIHILALLYMDVFIQAHGLLGFLVSSKTHTPRAIFSQIQQVMVCFDLLKTRMAVWMHLWAYSTYYMWLNFNANWLLRPSQPLSNCYQSAGALDTHTHVNGGLEKNVISSHSVSYGKAWIVFQAKIKVSSKAILYSPPLLLTSINDLSKREMYTQP